MRTMAEESTNFSIGMAELTDTVDDVKDQELDGSTIVYTFS